MPLPYSMDCKEINRIPLENMEIENFILNLYNNSEKLNSIKNKAKIFSEKKFFQSEKLFYTINDILEAR